jgi:hypothetical protein
MARRLVVGDLRVQQIARSDGRRSWTIVWPEGTEHAEADRSCAVTKARAHSALTPTCWSITCAGWSASA